MDFLDAVTPVVLSYNEAPNIERTLRKLRWAREVVVVDSGSTDDTVERARRFPNVRVVVNLFTSHAQQWNDAIAATGIASEWILALDADYVLSDELVDELHSLSPPAETSGYAARFVYCVHGRRLRSTLYPPVVVMYRRQAAAYRQDGHTQKVTVDGPLGALRNPIFHDDRKALDQWVAAQDRYARLEAAKLAGTQPRELRWPDRIRRWRVVAPLATLAYCLFAKGLVLDGWPGIYYSFQRAFAELLLSLYLVRRDLERTGPDTGER